jgi:Ca2+-binding RTX toxin-like protein
MWVYTWESFTMSSRIYFSDSATNLYSVDPLSSVLDATFVGQMSFQMTDLALSPSGKLYGISFDSIFIIDPVTAEVQFVSTHSLQGANGLFIAPNGTAYAGSFSTGGIYKMNLSTGEVALLPKSDLEIRSAGDITMLNSELIIATVDQRLVRVNLDTGATIGEVSHGIANLYGITTVGNTLFGVADGQLWKLDAYTGAKALFSDYDIFSIWGAALTEYGQSGDVTRGTGVSEVLRGTGLDDVMFGAGGNDSIQGGTGSDNLLGGAGRDVISGGKGADRLYGGTGSDKLSGNSGKDLLFGNSGKDQFIFNKLTDSSVRLSNSDQIFDFRNGDICNLRSIDANALKDGNNAFRLDNGGKFSAGEIKLSYSSGNTIARINVDHDKSAEMSILFRSAILDAEDFIL